MHFQLLARCEWGVQQLGAGRKAWGYFVSDMLLSEVQQLWATQSFPERDQSLDNKYRCARHNKYRAACMPCRVHIRRVDLGFQFVSEGINHRLEVILGPSPSWSRRNVGVLNTGGSCKAS